MFVKQSQAQSFEIPGGTQGVLYPPSPKGDQSVARVTVNGTYPKAGWSLNDICTETLYLLDGAITTWCDNEQYNLSPGDMLSILPGTRYRLEGNGSLMIFISPKWDSAQNHIVDA